MSGKPKKVVIRKSTDPKKKLEAIFSLDNGRTKTVRFGAAGMSDFPTHKDEARKKRYLARHRRRENWTSRLVEHQFRHIKRDLIYLRFYFNDHPQGMD